MLAKQSKIFFLSSLAALGVSIILAAWGIPKLVGKQIQKNIEIDNSSASFEAWRKIPIPLFFKVHVFNVTNADAVTGGAKPQLQEIGPYVFKEYREKTILGYGENDTIRYNLKKTFILDEEATAPFSMDDEVTVINFSYMAALIMVDDMMPSFVSMVNKAMEQFFSELKDPFLRVRVGDLFFDGVYVNCAGNNSALGLLCGKLKADLPPTMRPSEDGKGFYFSMFSHMNLTETGPFEVIRGRENIRELGHVVSYKGQTSMSQYWGGDQYCGKINGSDGSIFPPIDETHVPKRVYIFEPDVCRSLYASLVGKSTMYNMSAYHYEVASDSLAAKSANPDNKCFCRKNWSRVHDGCLVMGVFSVLPCQGAPAVASLPHFYLASEELLEYFDGAMQPDKEKHDTFMYLEPNTGIILAGVRRLQFNIELRRMENVPQLAKVQTGLFPLLWIEEGGNLPDDLIDQIKAVVKLLEYVNAVRWILLGLSVIATIISFFFAAKSGVIPLWPKSRNTVSFILGPTPNVIDVHKVN